MQLLIRLREVNGEGVRGAYKKGGDCDDTRDQVHCYG